MGMLLKRCPNCGAIDNFIDGGCSKCGFRLSASKVMAMETEAEKAVTLEKESNYDTLRLEEDNSQNAVSVERQSDKIDEPKAWMYILSIFNPILQCILMGVYVSKNDSSSAFKLFIIPFAIVASIAVIVLFMLL